MTQPTLIIPAYQPTEHLLNLIIEFRQHRPDQRIIVVDDGSDVNSQHIFVSLQNYKVEVLRHAVNLGKGQALKTAFNYYLNVRLEHEVGVITADADGQHACIDILAVSDALQVHTDHLHLGVRDFNHAAVPWRSRFGNIVTRFIVRQFCRSNIQDTQTGLRGIPDNLLAGLLKTKSTGYELELEMLLLAAMHGIHIRQTPISTIYISGNSASHFNPLVDSMKIYFVFIRFSTVSLISAMIDFIIFILSYGLFKHVFISLLLGRLFSATFNFQLNQKITFKMAQKRVNTAIKYACLAVLLSLIAYKLVDFFVDYNFSIISSKILAELILFIISFSIQKLLIFKRREKIA